MSVGMHLDQSMDVMEETRFKKKHAALIQRLAKELHFSYIEVESILLIYYKFQKEGSEHQPAMTKIQFKGILHNGLDLTDTELCDIMTTVFDKTPSPYFAMESWVRAMSLFLRGSLMEKIDFCFNVYNPLGDGKITRDHMVHLLRHAIIGEEETEDAVKDLIEVMTKKMDVDRDGKISYNDFKDTIVHHPLLLEAFGTVLPTRLAVHSFLTTFTPFIGKL